MGKLLNSSNYDEILDSDLWQSLEEAKKILLFTYNKLNNLTSDEFTKGGDIEIRDRIAKFLGIDGYTK